MTEWPRRPSPDQALWVSFARAARARNAPSRPRRPVDARRRVAPRRQPESVAATVCRPPDMPVGQLVNYCAGSLSDWPHLGTEAPNPVRYGAGQLDLRRVDEALQHARCRQFGSGRDGQLRPDGPFRRGRHQGVRVRRPPRRWGAGVAAPPRSGRPGAQWRPTTAGPSTAARCRRSARSVPRCLPASRAAPPGPPANGPPRRTHEPRRSGSRCRARRRPARSARCEPARPSRSAPTAGRRRRSAWWGACRRVAVTRLMSVSAGSRSAPAPGSPGRPAPRRGSCPRRRPSTALGPVTTRNRRCAARPWPSTGRPDAASCR